MHLKSFELLWLLEFVILFEIPSRKIKKICFIVLIGVSWLLMWLDFIFFILFSFFTCLSAILTENSINIHEEEKHTEIF